MRRRTRTVGGRELDLAQPRWMLQNATLMEPEATVSVPSQAPRSEIESDVWLVAPAESARTHHTAHTRRKRPHRFIEPPPPGGGTLTKALGYTTLVFACLVCLPLLWVGVSARFGQLA